MTIDLDATVIPNDFPEFKQLAWNGDASHAIPGREAFALYERNWRFVDTGRLVEEERQLIADLSSLHGNGILLVS